MSDASPFDIPWAQEFNDVRQTFIREFLEDVRKQAGLKSALDVGCGVGYLAEFLSGLGLGVVAVDGRQANIEEAKRRFPKIEFLVKDGEDLRSDSIGNFDLVLCAGLLYHLENPFRVVRNLFGLTAKLLLIETMCVPSKLSTMELLDEGVSENQGLNYVAFYPSEPCLVKMLYRAGFPFVYGFQRLPSHELYEQTVWRKRQRTFLAASKAPLAAPNLVLAKEIIRPLSGILNPWTTTLSRLRILLGRLASPVTKPLRRRLGSIP